MNLISVLETNGTGLLEGLCRPHSRSSSSVKDDSFLKLEAYDEIIVDFSIGTENLGTYKIKVEYLNEDSDFDLICSLNDEEYEYIFIGIKIGHHGNFGRFAATDCRR